MPACLTSAQLARDLAIPDLSDPPGAPGRSARPHAIGLLADLAVSALTSAWDCPARWYRGPRIVSIADNYDNLGYDPADVTRNARYTRYVDGQRMLRSHSTAMVPAALRELAASPPDDVLLACPGIAYRRDAIDWQHTGTPQQLDLWRISRRPLGPADLDQMIEILLAVLVPGRPGRQEPRVHPYTTGGRQVDAAYDGGWVEVWECGLAAPAVLARAGLAGTGPAGTGPAGTGETGLAGYHGLALGMGLDRLLMLRKGIPDIRLLRSADPRIAGQMRDLAPYRPVSAMPPVRRDLSVAVDHEPDDETIGDQIRDSLGPDADCVETVTILSAVPCADLPQAAAQRLGARPDQRNLLVRIVLRPPERTLTDEQANALRDRIYAALHQGTRHQWAAESAAAIRCSPV
jgi:phenylalanyl-tRNA synthetase alpha chain